MKIIAPAKMIRLAPVHSNIGVETAYRRKLQKLIDEMSDEYEGELTEAWKERPPLTTLAQDRSVPDFLDGSGALIGSHQSLPKCSLRARRTTLIARLCLLSGVQALRCLSSLHLPAWRHTQQHCMRMSA